MKFKKIVSLLLIVLLFFNMQPINVSASTGWNFSKNEAFEPGEKDEEQNTFLNGFGHLFEDQKGYVTYEVVAKFIYKIVEGAATLKSEKLSYKNSSNLTGMANCTDEELKKAIDFFYKNNGLNLKNNKINLKAYAKRNDIAKIIYSLKKSGVTLKENESNKKEISDSKKAEDIYAYKVGIFKLTDTKILPDEKVTVEELLAIGRMLVKSDYGIIDENINNSASMCVKVVFRKDPILQRIEMKGLETLRIYYNVPGVKEISFDKEGLQISNNKLGSYFDIMPYNEGVFNIYYKVSGVSYHFATVNVKGYGQHIYTIELPSKLDIMIGKERKMPVTVTPENYTSTLEWTSSNPKVATVDNKGNISALAFGKTTITCFNGSKKSSSVVTVVDTEKYSLSQETLVLPTGKTAQLEVYNNDAADIIYWHSDNSFVCNVNKTGKLSAEAEGETYIWAFNSTTGDVATCKVIVYLDPATKITLPASYTLNISETLQLKPTISSKYVYPTWESSDPKVAEVIDGLVVPFSYGTTEIKAKLFNGKEAICKIIVKKVYPQKISMTARKEMKVGEEFTLKVSYTPKNVDYKEIKFTSYNTNIVTVSDDGTVTAVKSGTTAVKAVSYGVTAFCIVTVK